MSKSSHQIAVTGVDQTAKTFQSIQARAIATGRRISSVMGGAIAAAGAAMLLYGEPLINWYLSLF